MVSVVHIIPGLDAAGTENMLLKIVRARTPATQHAVVSLTTLGTVGEKIQASGVLVKALGWRRGRVPGPVALRSLLATTKQLSGDVIQGWMYHGNLMASLARFWGRSRATAWSVRCSLGKEFESALTRGVIDFGARLSGSAAAIIYNSERARREHEAIGYQAARALVIPNGFDTDLLAPDPVARDTVRRRHGFDDGAFLIGHLARRHPVKDHETFLKCAEIVAAAVPKARFIAAGADVPALSTKTSLGQRVTLLDAVDDVRSYLNALDLFILSSRSEGFPNVLGEAMACGVPCIATDVGDCREIVGDAGVVVPSGDAGALAEAVIALALCDPEERSGIGARARARIVHRYSLSGVAAQYELLWHSLSEQASAKQSALMKGA